MNSCASIGWIGDDSFDTRLRCLTQEVRALSDVSPVLGALRGDVIARGIVALRRHFRGLAGALTLPRTTTRRPSPGRDVRRLRQSLVWVRERSLPRSEPWRLPAPTEDHAREMQRHQCRARTSRHVPHSAGRQHFQAQLLLRFRRDAGA
jgi:hypothetical protein